MQAQLELVVYFEMKPDRAQPFADFTWRHAGKQLAFVLDGAMVSAPVIRSALPGEGIISGSGGAGFTRLEASVLAHILHSGQRLDATLQVARVNHRDR